LETGSTFVPYYLGLLLGENRLPLAAFELAGKNRVEMHQILQCAGLWVCLRDASNGQRSTNHRSRNGMRFGDVAGHGKCLHGPAHPYQPRE
jgi:hypothetical protein